MTSYLTSDAFVLEYFLHLISEWNQTPVYLNLGGIGLLLCDSFSSSITLRSDVRQNMLNVDSGPHGHSETGTDLVQDARDGGGSITDLIFLIDVTNPRGPPVHTDGSCLQLQFMGDVHTSSQAHP